MEKWLEEIPQVWQMWYFWIHSTIQSAKKRNRLATEVWATGNSEAALPMLVISRISTRNHTPWRCALEKEGLTPYHIPPLRILYETVKTVVSKVSKPITSLDGHIFNNYYVIMKRPNKSIQNQKNIQKISDFISQTRPEIKRTNGMLCHWFDS